MRSTSLLLFVVACTALAANFEFKARSNLTDADTFFIYRDVILENKSYENLMFPCDAVKWSSSSHVLSAINRTTQVDVVASGFVPGISAMGSAIPPFSYCTYIPDESTFDFDIFTSAVLSGGMGKAAYGSIIYAVVGVREVEESGSVSRGVRFASAWPTPTVVETSDDSIRVFKSTLTNANGVFTLYAVSSDIAGVLDYASAPVSPNTFTLILEVSGYTYAKEGNHLELVLAGITVDEEGKGNFTNDVVYRKSGEDVLTYIAFRDSATIDSVLTPVNITPTASLKGYNIDNVLSLLTGLFKVEQEDVDISVAYRLIHFPAGAKDISYDVITGSGKNVYDAVYIGPEEPSSSSSSSSPVPSSSSTTPTSLSSSSSSSNSSSHSSDNSAAYISLPLVTIFFAILLLF